MLQDTYQERRKAELQDLHEPTMSAEFLNYMIERITNILLARLKTRGDKYAVRLLENLVILLMFPQQIKKGKVAGMFDENIVAIVGELTYMIGFEEK